MRRWVAIVFLFATIVAVNPASAHTEVVSTTPASGERLDRAPTQVTITTVEPVREFGSAIVVTSPSGARVDDGSTEIDGKVTLVGLIALTEFGTYTVDYRLLASDGHPIEGSFTFALAEGAVTQSPEPEPTQTPTVDPTTEPQQGQSAFPWWVLAGIIVLLSASVLAYRARR